MGKLKLFVQLLKATEEHQFVSVTSEKGYFLRKEDHFDKKMLNFVKKTLSFWF